MPYERTGYAPWSLTREAGVESATVDGTIQVPQYVYPNLDTGFIDEKGVWQGRKSDDRTFIGLTTAEGIANGGDVLFPDTDTFPSINMAGFLDLFIAYKVSRGGNYALNAVMGPDTTPFANLTPVSAARNIKIAGDMGTANSGFVNVLNDTAEELHDDGWNIFKIQGNLKGQRSVQIKTTNNSGGSSDIIFGFMRLI